MGRLSVIPHIPGMPIQRKLEVMSGVSNYPGVYEPLFSGFAAVSHQLEAADLGGTINADRDSQIADTAVHIQ